MTECIVKKYALYDNLTVILLSFLFIFLNPSRSVYAKEQNRFSFVVMGCMHLGVCDFKDYELAVKKIEECEPDFMLLLGGMIDPCAGESIESLWDKFDLVNDKLKVPAYNLSGMCRLVNTSSLSEDKEVLMEQCFIKRYRKRYYSFEYKHNLFIGLDAEELFNYIDQEKNSTNIGNQINFLNNLLANSSHYDNIFIFLHESPWFQDKKDEWFKVIHPLIKDKVKFVFGSSAHYIHAEQIDGVTYVTTGSPCFLNRILSKPSFPNFLIAEVDNERVDIKIVPVKPIPLEHLVYSLIQKEFSLLTLESRSKEWEITKAYRLLGNERETFLKPEHVIKALKIRPGMNILDIGAGAGYFTFRLAESLKGTGEVFATDIDPKMIAYIKNEAENKKYKNVFPVFVKADEVDPFYIQHTFDIIFLSEGFHYLRHPEDYFKQLRPTLSKDGRLYIIHSKNVFDFTEIEFNDFDHAMKTFVSEGENFPVFKRLSKKLRDFIRDWKGGDIASQIKNDITHDFNKMLLDASLFYDLMDYYSAKKLALAEGEWSAPLPFVSDSMDLRLARWLFVQLDAGGVFNKKRLSDEEKKQLSKFNRIMLTKIFKIYKIVYLQGEYSCPLYAEKESVIATMESAGYTFVREYGFLPYHYFLEFKSK